MYDRNRPLLLFLVALMVTHIIVETALMGHVVARMRRKSRRGGISERF